jgi:hypothetical protein
VLHAEPNKTLSGVAAFLADPGIEHPRDDERHQVSFAARQRFIRDADIVQVRVMLLRCAAAVER